MNLKPVDFKAVAAKGCFVYCYLRADGSPYYVGLASYAGRPFDRHSCGVPSKHSERVRVLRSGLTREEAVSWERYYIAHYGRKDLGTGILRNQTEGGDGGDCGPEGKAKISAYRTGKKLAPHVKDMLLFHAQQPRTDEWKKGLTLKHAKKTAEKYGLPLEAVLSLGPKERAAMKTRFYRGVRGLALLPTPEDRLKANAQRGMTERIHTALRYDICPCVYGLFSQWERKTYRQRFSSGLRGDALFARLGGC